MRSGQRIILRVGVKQGPLIYDGGLEPVGLEGTKDDPNPKCNSDG